MECSGAQARSTFTTALDPGGVDSGGVIGLDNADGSIVLETPVFENGTFGLGPFLDKANGLGDLDSMSDRAVIAYTTGYAGETDHSLDIGVVQEVTDLEVEKLASRNIALVGEQIEFTIRIFNNPDNARLPATGVFVQDVIPTGMTYVAGSAVPTNGVFDGTFWTLTNPLNPGDTHTLSFRVTVTGNVGDALVNTAEVIAANEPDFDSTPFNDDGVTVGVCRDPPFQRRERPYCSLYFVDSVASS